MKRLGERLMLRFVLAIVMASGSVRTAEPAADAEVEWQAVYLAGQRIGYGRLESETFQREGQTIHRSQSHLHTVMKRFDGKVTLLVDEEIEETSEGRLLGVRMVIENPPASRIETVGRVDGRSLRLTTTSAGQSTTSEIELPDDLTTLDHLVRSLESDADALREPREVNVFDLSSNTVRRLRVSDAGKSEDELLRGKTVRGRKVLVEYLDGIPGLTLELYLDESGSSIASRIPLLQMTTLTVTREEALEEIPTDVDLVLAGLMQSSKIPQPRQVTRAVLRVTGEEPIDPGQFSQSGVQSVEAIDEAGVRVTVVSVPADPDGSGSKRPGEEYLANTSYLHWKDDEIRRLAERAGEADASSAEVARAAEKLVHSWLRRKTLSSHLATASEVVRSREGDCSEHAVLLAALLRAREIPSRVVVGALYVEKYSAFVGHMWTEAWIADRWVPLDATQGWGRVDAARIKFSESALADHDPGLIDAAVNLWHLMGRVRVEAEEIEHRPLQESTRE